MRHSRWLFFDLGNTLISEEAATEARIQQLVDSFERYGRRSSVEDVRSAFQQASREFAPRLITRVIEKLSNDPKRHKLILAESRYPKKRWRRHMKVSRKAFGHCRLAIASE
jgi:FMN phosphatase YigB (HAD superfamily)